MPTIKLNKKTKKTVFLALSLVLATLAGMFFRLEQIGGSENHVVSALFLLSFTVFLAKYLKLKKNLFR